jgi:large subunit ribosomal protein L19
MSAATKEGASTAPVKKSGDAILREIEAEYLRTDLPSFRVGDTVRINVRIQEGGKERLQAYEGTVIGERGGGINRTITVRKIFQGIGVERVFMLHAPSIDSLAVTRRGMVRRAKLYYLRDRVGKRTRVKERIMTSEKS